MNHGLSLNSARAVVQQVMPGITALLYSTHGAAFQRFHGIFSAMGEFWLCMRSTSFKYYIVLTLQSIKSLLQISCSAAGILVYTTRRPSWETITATIFRQSHLNVISLLSSWLHVTTSLAFVSSAMFPCPFGVIREVRCKARHDRTCLNTTPTTPGRSKYTDATVSYVVVLICIYLPHTGSHGAQHRQSVRPAL